MIFGGDEWWFHGPRIIAGDLVHNERIPLDLRRLIQDADLSQNVPLRTDDTIVVPDVVAGVNPQEIPERRIYVLGRVQRPGMYTIRQEVPILHAIFLAGGFVEPGTAARPQAGEGARPSGGEVDRGDLSNAFVIRGKERIQVDLRRLIQKGDLSQNVMIRHEDMIVIPDPVQTPAIHRLRGPLLKYAALSMVAGALLYLGGVFHPGLPGAALRGHDARPGDRFIHPRWIDARFDRGRPARRARRGVAGRAL